LLPDSKYENRIEEAQKNVYLQTKAEMSRVIVGEYVSGERGRGREILKLTPLLSEEPTTLRS